MVGHLEFMSLYLVGQSFCMLCKLSCCDMIMVFNVVNDKHLFICLDLIQDIHSEKQAEMELSNSEVSGTVGRQSLNDLLNAPTSSPSGMSQTIPILPSSNSPPKASSYLLPPSTPPEIKPPITKVLGIELF